MYEAYVWAIVPFCPLLIKPIMRKMSLASQQVALCCSCPCECTLRQVSL